MFVSHCTDALMASVFVTIYIIIYPAQSPNIALLSCLLWTLGIVNCFMLNILSCLLQTLVVWYLATVARNLHRAFYYIPQTYRITEIVSNNQSLYETWESLCDHIQDMSNPRSEENGEPLRNHENPFNVNKVNPQHPQYGYYKSLISDLQAWDEYMDSVISDPEDDRPVGGKRKSGWKKPCVHGLFNHELDSYAYNDYIYMYSASKNCSNVCSFFNDCIGTACWHNPGF